MQSLLWKGFESCGSAWSNRDAGIGFNVPASYSPAAPNDVFSHGFDSATLAYPDVPSLLSFTVKEHGYVFDCAFQLQNLFNTLQAQACSAICYRYVSRQVEAPICLIQPSDQNKYYSKDELEVFIQEVYQPLWLALRAYWPSDRWGSMASLFASLGSPSPNTADLRHRVSILYQSKGKLTACSSSTLLRPRSKPYSARINRHLMFRMVVMRGKPTIA